MLSLEEKQICLKIARESIYYRLNAGKSISECPLSSVFMESFGLFVTLHKCANLRGCIGYIKPYKPLYYSLIDLAQAAAFNDSRFNPVTVVELEHLVIEISILSPLTEVLTHDEIIVGRDGLFLQHPWGTGLLLPQVAVQYNWSREKFLQETCYKACLDESFLLDEHTKLYRFEAEIFSEEDYK